MNILPESLHSPQVIITCLALASLNSLVMWKHITPEIYGWAFLGLMGLFFAEDIIYIWRHPPLENEKLLEKGKDV